MSNDELISTYKGNAELALEIAEPQKRTKGIYIGAPAVFKLEMAVREVCDAFPDSGFGCYVVGSSLERPDWRDVDVRFIMSDDGFAETFPDAGQYWEHDARWLLLTTCISDRLSRLTGLPVDFQFQPQTHANERHKGQRSAIGLRIASQKKLPAPAKDTQTSNSGQEK